MKAMHERCIAFIYKHEFFLGKIWSFFIKVKMKIMYYLRNKLFFC